MTHRTGEKMIVEISMDQIPAKFLKEVGDVLAYPLSRIVNLSVRLSVFLEECKIAKLEPLFKKGSKTDPKIYRAISRLPEKETHYQLPDHLKENGLLYKYHSGFRAKFSTGSCLPQQTDFVLTGVDKRIHTGMILIDLQKALDIPDHKIFLEKMTYTGFKILIINWFESYLSNKKLFVSVDDFFSEAGILN